jgi:hypothetical protein
MGHTPRTFISNAQLPFQCLGGHPMPGAAEKIHGEEPFRRVSREFMEDGSGAGIDVMAAILAGIAPPLFHAMRLGTDPASLAFKRRPAVLNLYDLVEASRIGQVFFLGTI